ncbi:hypothetical protein C8F04DRAFT_1238711 [Mycena alexandri]|uniref:Uncharacterized protein n=1 Tax=Mycena alexandri TaxID=1745969 RepID=A0AAD6SGA2_9AGAR|nr:hypothetical protein C8F04DRAFT_1238711 [Mycena alexandri]
MPHDISGKCAPSPALRMALKVGVGSSLGVSLIGLVCDRATVAAAMGRNSLFNCLLMLLVVHLVVALTPHYGLNTWRVVEVGFLKCETSSRENVLTRLRRMKRGPSVPPARRAVQHGLSGGGFDGHQHAAALDGRSARWRADAVDKIHNEVIETHTDIRRDGAPPSLMGTVVEI